MTDELDQLRTLHDDAAPSAQARGEARAALLAAAAAESGAGRRRGWARTLLRRRRPVVAVACLGLVAAAVATVSGLDDGRIDPSPATARGVLEAAALVAADAPDVPLGPSQYWYSASEHVGPRQALEPRRAAAAGALTPSYVVVSSFRRETWTGADGAGRVRHEPLGQPAFLDDAARLAWVEAGRPELATGTDIDVAVPATPDGAGGRGDRRYGFGSTRLSYADLRALPTGTDALAERLRDLVPSDGCTNRPSQTTPCASDDRPMALFQLIAGLLRETPAPPDLRAALYRVAAGIPGIALASRGEDSRGRPGVAVALANPYERRELVFDPETATLLAERAVTLRDQRAADGHGSLIPAGTETEVTYLESGPVDSTAARP